ncbi:EAL domain-containing protein [Shewanella sp. Scap07]|uniref:sensor domain-containing protein n=1 Tax=Shewanella sp. Scap07 TaxID=2589987 RepID=UPI0015B7A619|nr:EAL domain-containing protein [Shewanella sp. Scap07]QLE87356.1 EAL domain-containing protein [Shewanella sp. Scap07]
MDLWSDTLSQLRSSHADTERHIIAWQSASSLPMLAVIKDFHFIHATAQTLAYFESQAENFINATPYDFSPRIQSSGRNSIEFAQHVMQEAARGSIKSFDWLHMSQQGAELPTKVTLYPASLNEQAVLIAELTPVNRRSRTRKSSRNGFESLPKQLLSIALEDSAEAVYITDSQHKIIAVNKAMCRICGYSADQLLGRSQDFIDSSRTNDVVDKSYLGTLEERGNWQGEVEMQRSDATHFPAWKSCRKIHTEQTAYFITLFSDISSKKKLEDRLTEQALFDTLTGLPNRHQLKEILNQALVDSKQQPHLVGALMFMDLNGFKNINDCFGHATGDKVLQLVSARLEACCIEKADIARLGGDEFTLVLQGCVDRNEVEEVSRQVMQVFDAPFEIDGQKFYLGTSVGIAMFPEHSDQASQLLSFADTAMYCAKKSPNHLLFYSASMHEDAEKKLNMLSELRHAHSLNQFQLAYQVIVNLECNSVIGAEALLRWQKPDGQIVPAVEFVPLLEEAGLLITLGQWVLNQACSQIAKWRASHDTDLKACVNISPTQLAHPDFLEHVTTALERSNLPADGLVLEITESALLRQPELIKATLIKLKGLGINIAIDDFGAGLSSLSKLGSLPIDSLKIDAGFAQRLSEPQGKELCQAMIQLAQALDISFVVEGVETRQQKELLARMGKGFAQGYFFGHPSAAEQFTSDNFDD